MNKLNYASLEASKKLHEAGIVLETEAVWAKWYSDNYPHSEYKLVYKALVQIEEFNEQYPAPSMAEVLRELPNNTAILKNRVYYSSVGSNSAYKEFISENPADALIELLVWLEKEKLRETEAVKKDPVIDKNSAAYMDN